MRAADTASAQDVTLCLPDPSELVDISVVVPTYNRRQQLGQVIEALSHQVTTTQSGADFSFEIVVVSDGSTDDTHDYLRALPTDVSIHAIAQPNSGPAAARNKGVDLARGALIVFIDDDVLAEPNCLAAHFECHRNVSDLVVFGPMLTPEGNRLSPWVAWEQHQLEKQYAAFGEGGTAHHRQFYTGNASLSAADFRRCGGFDTSLRRAEDVELADRLNGAGLHFEFEPDAHAFHHAERSLESWQKIATAYGRNDIVFAQGGMENAFENIRRFYSERHPGIRACVRTLIPRPWLADRVNPFFEQCGIAAARIGMHRSARQLLSVSYNVRYYAGAADELGGSDEFFALLRREGSPSLAAWFVLEQTLGHITHSKNLRSIIPRLSDVEATFFPVDASLEGPAARIPGWSNWTIRAGIRARRAVARTYRGRKFTRPDVMFIHSQVPAVLLGSWMKRIPSVVSLDATPLQYDELGEVYAHEVGTGPAERLKKWANERCYRRAEHCVTWSEWAKASLVDDYGVPAHKVTVIAPGVDVDMWSRPSALGERSEGGPLRVLFVGGDLRRKGGDLLLSVADDLRRDPSIPEFEVHLCSTAEVEDQPGVVIHRGLTANSPELIEQYHLADIFCLPTLGDCLPMVLAEAGAAGLPLVSTDVGAISGIVREGETGHLIEPRSDVQLAAALTHLLRDADARRTFGAAAHALVTAEHDAAKNAGRIIEVLGAAAAERSTRPRLGLGRVHDC